MLHKVAKKVILARSEEGNAELLSKLSRTGVSAMTVESIRFEKLTDWSEVDKAIRNIDSFDWLVFTSPNAVKEFTRRLKRLGAGVADLKPSLAAVGPSTARELRESGCDVSFIPREYLTSALGAELPDDKGTRVLLLRADIAEKALALSLKRRGFTVTDMTIYKTRPVEEMIDSERVEGATLVIFASPSEVRGFRGRLRPGDLGKLIIGATAACIGPVTAEAASEAGFSSVVISRIHTVDSLVELVKEQLPNA